MAKVLFVDDDEVTLFLYKRMAKTLQLTAQYATNGKEALEQFESFKPDCVFLDLNMPVMGGEAMLESLKGKTDLPDIYVMLGTRLHAHNELANKGLPITDYIRKPLSADAVKEVLSKLNNKV